MKLDTYEKRMENSISRGTLNPRLSALRSLEKNSGGGEIDVNDVEEWLDHLIDRYNNGEIKASTVQEYFKAARSYFGTIKGDKSALDHIDWLPENDSDPGDYLTEAEWEAMYSNIYNVKYKAIFSLMYHYARRPSEIIFLNKEDIDFEEDTIRFLILKKNNRKLPTIEIGGEERKLFRATYRLKEEPKEKLQEAMRYMPKHEETIVEDGEERTVEPLFTTGQGRISYSSVHKACKKAAERAGIDKNVTPKVMRHSRATHLDWGGNAPGNIGRDMLIHSPDTNVINRYIHDREGDEVREVMDIKENEDV